MERKKENSIMSKKQKKWEDCTPAERRVLIAKDALDSVVAGKYRCIGTGYYIDSKGMKLKLPKPDTVARKSHCEMIGRTCTMCARGALLLSRAVRFNQLKLFELGLHGNKKLVAWCRNTHEGLDGAFTNKQLSLIEAAFEANYTFAEEEGYSEAVSRQAEQFGDDHPDHANRLIAILQNIIDHNGTFKPAVRYEIYER